MKALLSLTLAAALGCSTAFAACQAPTSSVSIPSGAKATKDEMVAAQKAVKAYDAEVKAYAECLRTDQDAEIAAAGDKLADDQRNKIVARYAELQNKEVDKLQKVADQFNAELKAWRAKNPS